MQFKLQPWLNLWHNIVWGKWHGLSYIFNFLVNVLIMFYASLSRSDWLETEWCCG